MFKFLKSKRHRGLYLKLAFRYFMSPDHVRRLAHGQEYSTKKEKMVHDILLRQGVVHRHRHHDED